METETIQTKVTPIYKNRNIKWLTGLVMVVMLVALLWFTIGRNFLLGEYASSEYQSVFLSNGQVYFGKLNFSGSWIKLRDVYYLQVTDPLQPQGDEDIPTQREKNIQLIKLGSELHGPEDEMFIDRDQILFWENMKDDSKVLQSIRDYKIRNGL